MSSFINKAKDKIEAALSKDSNQADHPQSSNAGPHSSNMANKADPRVDSDRDHRNDPTSRVGGYGDTQVGGGQGAGFAQSDTYGSAGSHPGYDNPQSTNTGPHSSNIANKVDPRVDSDNDRRNDPTSRIGGVGNTQTHGDNYGTAGGPGGLGTTDTGYGGNTGGHGQPGEGYGGSHTHTGTSHAHSGAGHSGLAAATTTGHTGHGGHAGSAATYDDPRSTNTGPHGSNLANKVDPRVDSDRDNRNDPTSRVGGYGTQAESHGDYGTHGAHGTHGTHGAHSATTHSGYGQGGIAPEGEVSQGSGYTAATGAGDGLGSYGTPGSGNTTKTAGPHNSDIMNKLDPRVDSDMDGSKTYGGNATHR